MTVLAPVSEEDRRRLGRLADHAARYFGAREAEPIRVAMTGVYRCAAGIIRISGSADAARSSLRSARVIDRAGIPIARPLSDEIVGADGFEAHATLWADVVDDGSEVDWFAVGEALARVHALELDDVGTRLELPSPTSFWWWDVDAVLDRLGDLIDGAARRSLEEVIDRTRSWRSLVESDPVVCHGDLHPGNVISTAAGPVLIDWDLMCIAHRGWDHAPVIGWTRAWGGEGRMYEALASGYGADLSVDPPTRLLTDLRLVVATLMRVEAGRHDPAAAAEAERRLAYWRTGVLESPWIAQ